MFDSSRGRHRCGTVEREDEEERCARKAAEAINNSELHSSCSISDDLLIIRQPRIVLCFSMVVY